MMSTFEENRDAMAKAYEAFTEDEDSYSYQIEWPCIQTLLPDLKNTSILDLGCGTGRYGFLFEGRQPGSILGIDISEKMLEIGRGKAKAQNSIVEFQKGDINRPENIADAGFDFIFSSAAFHSLPDLSKAFRSIHRLLKNEGTCIVSVMHPVYTAQYPIAHNGVFPEDEDWNVRYLDKSLRAYVQPWVEYNEEIDNYLSTSYHHTVSDYINAIIRAGLTVQRVEEPAPPKEWKEKFPGRYKAYIETPSFMIFKLKK